MSLLERIYFFHEELKNNRFPNSRSLSDQFEVSSATARRDIAYLRDRLLAPLAFANRKNGFYYHDYTFRLPFENSPKIITLLALLGKLADEAGLSELPEVQKLTDRLATLLDPDLNRLLDRISYEWIETESIDPHIFSIILEALIRSRSLEMVYRSIKGEKSSRRVDPLRLTNYQGRWYLFGFCHLRNGFRLFHIARITSIRELDQPISSHKQDTGYLDDSFGILTGKTVYKAKVLFTSTAAELVRHQHWHKDQRITDTKEGILLTIPVSDDRELMMKILQYGRMAEVIEPPELRKRIKDDISAMADIYKR